MGIGKVNVPKMWNKINIINKGIEEAILTGMIQAKRCRAAFYKSRFCSLFD